MVCGERRRRHVGQRAAQVAVGAEGRRPAARRRRRRGDAGRRARPAGGGGGAGGGGAGGAGGGGGAQAELRAGPGRGLDRSSAQVAAVGDAATQVGRQRAPVRLGQRRRRNWETKKQIKHPRRRPSHPSHSCVTLSTLPSNGITRRP